MNGCKIDEEVSFGHGMSIVELRSMWLCGPKNIVKHVLLISRQIQTYVSIQMPDGQLTRTVHTGSSIFSLMVLSLFSIIAILSFMTGAKHF